MAPVPALPGLANGLEHLARLIRHRDPSLEKQERRHFGVAGRSVSLGGGGGAWEE
jgi:hypothetical protein